MKQGMMYSQNQQLLPKSNAKDYKDSIQTGIAKISISAFRFFVLFQNTTYWRQLKSYNLYRDYDRRFPKFKQAYCCVSLWFQCSIRVIGISFFFHVLSDNILGWDFCFTSVSIHILNLIRKHIKTLLCRSFMITVTIKVKPSTYSFHKQHTSYG